MTEPERIVPSGDAELCTQAFGDPHDPAVLLIMGQMASMLWWPDGLCERLAERGLYVIRYDNRDTGRSTTYPSGRPGYTGDAFVADPIAVLDGYGIERAHVVGMSMGGAIAQVVAANFPDRVATLTLISTTGLAVQDPDLPGSTQRYTEHARAFEDLDWSDSAAIAEMLVAEARAVTGAGRAFDEEATRELVDRDLKRARDPGALANHPLIPDGTMQAGAITAPTLVIHGTDDPLFPIEHGVALARATGAELVSIEGGGHELHEDDWDRIADAIAAHAAG